ncbi:MAG: hypothetical protein MR393_01305 [Intestinimonas massiliensis]|uniref:hypothetical protein n=1 Tax=Intestinimonas TaxID=1392389 RepID=UPI00242EB930|nr:MULTISPECIES: hypothetical protein [Intestinimonas]MCI5561766.1 hypothetical protein [Intestinimonas massiliensis (ex Afouda et al. 2020)]MDY5339187.1 hypothetical protein [Intestinimonas sp.]
MSVIDTLVTDRTEADASRYSELRDKGWAAMTTAERAEWVAGMKGAYNASDLNRVASAMSYLSQRFASAGYSVPVSSPTDWANGDIPRKDDLDTYLDDLRRIRAALAVMDTTPSAPESMDYLTWAKANDIEKILVDVDDALGRLLLSPFYSGEIYSGEV